MPQSWPVFVRDYHVVCLSCLPLSASGYARGGWGGANIAGFVSWVWPYLSLAIAGPVGVGRISRGLSLGFGPISLWPSAGPVGVGRISMGLSLGFGPIGLWPPPWRVGWSEYHEVCLLGLALLVSGHRRGGWGGGEYREVCLLSLALSVSGHRRGRWGWGEYRWVCLLVCAEWPLSQSCGGMEGRVSRYLSLGLAQFEL